MTELAAWFVLALADRGYGLVFADDDLIVLSSDRRTRFHIPGILLEDPSLELLLVGAITGFADAEGIRWSTRDGDGPQPGTN